MKYEVTLNGKKYEVEVEEGKAIVLNESTAAPVTPAPVPTQTSTPVASAPAGSGTPVNAPLPGTVLNVKVSNGQSVKKGDVLVIIEAMKMENEIMAPSDGTVSTVAVTKGQSVESGTPLVYLA